MHTKKELDILLTQVGITPLKSLGQNFLVNPMICEKIIQSSGVSHAEQIIEIGPGLGALTRGLIDSKKPLRLIELDKGLADYWSKQEGVEVIHKDALRVNWSELLDKKTLIISNLPYSIAASLVLDLCLEDPEKIHSMVFMFQKEVALRFDAKMRTKDYGMPSVMCQNFFKIEKVVDAGPQDFHPVPNVGSRVLKMTPLKVAEVNRPAFLNFVKKAFSQRRKKLKIPDLPELAIYQGKRPEELSPADFLKVFQAINK